MLKDLAKDASEEHRDRHVPFVPYEGVPIRLVDRHYVYYLISEGVISRSDIYELVYGKKLKEQQTNGEGSNRSSSRGWFSRLFGYGG